MTEQIKKPEAEKKQDKIVEVRAKANAFYKGRRIREGKILSVNANELSKAKWMEPVKKDS